MSAALVVKTTCQTYVKTNGYTVFLIYTDFIKYVQLNMISWIHFPIYG